MKKLFFFIYFGLWLVGFTTVRAQEYDYIINARTGKFDAVNSKKSLSKTLDLKFNGDRTVTRPGLPAINTGDTTVINWLNNYFFPEPGPEVTITTATTSREFMAAGAALTLSLDWTVKRPAQSSAISSITVNGVSISPDPLAEGATQTGTLANQPLNRNTVTTYAITAINTSNFSATKTVTVQWYWKRYWGAFASAVPPSDGGFTITDANILALTGAGVGTGNELSTTLVKNYDGINGGGNYLVFAWPSSWGTPTFVINGLVSTAFTRVRSNLFVNAVGGSVSYDVWVSDTQLNSPIAQFQINKQ